MIFATETGPMRYGRRTPQQDAVIGARDSINAQYAAAKAALLAAVAGDATHAEIDELLKTFREIVDIRLRTPACFTEQP